MRYALNRLKKEEFLQEKFHFKDARQSLYGLKNIPTNHGIGEMPVNDAISAEVASVF